MLSNLSLKLKLPIYLTVAFALVGVSISFVAYREVRRASLEAAEERLNRVTTQLADLAELGFGQRLTEVTGLASDPATVALLDRSNDADARAAVVAAASAVAEAPQVGYVEYRDREGRRIVEVGDRTLVPVELVAPSAEGGVIGPLVQLARGIGSAASADVVRDGVRLGTVSVWRPVQLSGQTLQVLADLVGIEGGVLFGSPGGAWTNLAEVVEPPPVALEGSTLADLGHVVYERPEVGPVFAGLQQVGTTSWYVGAELPEDDVLAGPRAFLVRMLLLGPIALLVVAGSAWILGGTLTSSLAETARAAEAISAGEFGKRVRVRGDDEVGRLAASFNAMAEQVERSQQVLQDRNTALQTMLEDAPAPIIAIDMEGNVSLWNRAAERVFGFAKDDTIGWPLRVVDETGSPLGLGPQGSDPVRETRCFRRDGRPLDLLVARATIRDAAGEVDGTMLVCEDITARKNAEKQLARYAEELSRSNAELEEFAYVASHDLREPIRMVRSFTKLLSQRYSGRLDEDADRYIAFAMDGASRMEVLIKDLLEYSRIDGAPRDPQPTSLVHAVEQATTVLATSIEESGAAVTFGELPTVVADSEEIIRVFQNLIGNALKFHGDEPPRIHVSATVERGQCVVSVRDNGIGIAEEYFDRIFVIFKRLHAAQEFGGTGIGLSICKKIVERHGGRIWVESEPGVGSTFFFSLPAAAEKVA